MDWQPIRSVPRGNKEILVLWSTGERRIEIMPCHTARDYAEPEMEGGAHLTHWMHLPPIPKKDKHERSQANKK